jgi:hypothetical protein
MVVGSTPEAVARFRELRILSEGQPKGLGRSIWARALQKAHQLSLVYACSADAEAPVVDLAAAEWACQLAAYLTRRMIYLADMWVADGEFDRRQKQVLRHVVAAGGRISHSALVRKLQRMTARERGDLIHNLVETRQLARIEEDTRGRTAVFYAMH